MFKSKVVIGTWPLSGDLGNISKSNAHKTLDHCVKAGFTEFDTAPSYGGGRMESLLGDIFGDDENITINTKCGNSTKNEKNFSLDGLKESLDGSLERLKRKSVNILFLHNPRSEIKDLLPIINFFDYKKNNGSIKYSGLSAAKGFKYNLAQYNRLDVFQDDVNLLSLTGLLKCKSENKCFYARSPLATGILSGKMNDKTVFDHSDYRSNWLKDNRLRSILKRVSIIQNKTDIKLPSLARRFVLNLDNVDKVIFGLKSIDHLEDLIEDLNAPPLEYHVMQSFIKLYHEDFGIQDNEKSLGY